METDRAEIFSRTEPQKSIRQEFYQFKDVKAEVAKVYEIYKTLMTEAAYYRKMADNAHLKQNCEGKIYDAFIGMFQILQNTASFMMNNILFVANLEWTETFNDPYGKYAYAGWALCVKPGPRSMGEREVIAYLGDEVRQQALKAQKEGYTPPAVGLPR